MRSSMFLGCSWSLILKWRSVHGYFPLSEFFIWSFSDRWSFVELLIKPAFLCWNGLHFFVGHSLAHVVSFLSFLTLADEVTSVLADLDPWCLIYHLIKCILFDVGLIAAKPTFFAHILYFVFEWIVLSIWCHLEVELVIVSLWVTPLEIWIDFLVWFADEANQLPLVDFWRLLWDEAVVFLAILEDILRLLLLSVLGGVRIYKIVVHFLDVVVDLLSWGNEVLVVVLSIDVLKLYFYLFGLSWWGWVVLVWGLEKSVFCFDGLDEFCGVVWVERCVWWGVVQSITTFDDICLIGVGVGYEKIFRLWAIGWFRFIDDFLCFLRLILIEVYLLGLVNHYGGFDHLFLNCVA